MRSLIFVLLATGAIAAPLSYDKGKTHRCDKRLDRFHHEKEFPYNYEGETISSIQGASTARSGLKIRARCVIKAVEPCQHVLKLDTVELWEAQSKNPGPLKYHVSRGSTAFAEELEAQDLVFRTDRGRITEILAHPEEPPHVLNIKRGILSALQVQFVNEHAVLEEDDVVGKCKVQYTIKSRHISGRPKVIYKTRNLTECSDRAQTDVGIHVHSYEEKPLSLLNSHSTCKMYLTAKTRTQKVVCEEQHIFRPFSAGYKNTSGAITTTRQVLELQSIKTTDPEPVAIEEFRSVSLKYAHSTPVSNEDAIINAYYLVSRLTQQSRTSTKPDSAQHFSELVFSIRKLNTPAMEKLWQKVHQEEDEKMHEYLYDALPHCGTGGCAKVMSYAIREKLVSHERGNMFLAGLAMASNPTKETVEHVLELCEENPGRTAMLTLGTLIHKVCESNPRECDEKEEGSPITKAESFFKSRLGFACEGSTPEDFENMLITLKAIGNAGRPASAEHVLLRCALNLNAPVNMSIAALEALRRLPCNNHTTEQLLKIYGEHDLDVEIRIAAYLALMKCPSPSVFKEVARILNDEVNNQVGSFVWSHMTNAMDSTEPVHGLPQAEMMKDALNGMKLREFNLNRLKFSRAWEGSFYSDVLRFGGSAQSHIIFHPSSFFPRSAMLNITVDVLGASINVLETAARFEGVEILIEQFFGDEGYFPDDRIMKMFNLKPYEERDKEERTVNKVLRRQRSLSIEDDINRVENHLHKLHRKMDNRMHHPSGALSVKMFGNEIRLASFNDISWLNDEIDKVNVIDFLLLMAKGGKKTFSKSMMFLDAQTTVPTILGLPLKLSAKGTTVASVELAGKFDIRNMFWGKMKFDIRGHVKPSAVVDISGRMGVSAVHAEAGILVNSSVYTVTQIKGNATYSQGELLKFEVGVPEEPVQFFNFSSSLFTTLNDEKQAIEGTPRRLEPSPCLNMTRLLGLRFCGQLSLPLGYRDLHSPFYPLSGPASYSISMQRTDPKLTKYQLLAERLSTEDENRYDVIATMSTPGATWERNFDANVTLWLKEDGKLFTLSTGALGTKFGTFEAIYNNNTHALNLTYSAKDAVYGHPIILNGQFFNNTKDSLSRELGIQLSASYRNYTIKQLTKLYNRSGAYGFVNNITYWPEKYLYASGELNIPKRNVRFLANHTCTKTEISFNGNLGEEENSFLFNFDNKPTKAGIELTGRHLKAEKKGVIHLFARPCNQSFTLRGSYAESGNEKGIRFTASHDNRKRLVGWYAGIVNSTKEKSIKANATVLGSKAEAVWSYFNLTQEKGFKFNGLLLNKTFDAAWLYFNAGQEKGLKFNATSFNKTMQAAWTFLNVTTGKSLKFNASVINKTVEAVWSYVSIGQEKGLRLNALALNYTMDSTLVFQNVTGTKSIKINATVVNKTLEAVWSYVNAGKEKGLRFNITGFNKTADAMWSYFNHGVQRGIRFNASALNKTVDATWTFVNLTNEKSLKFKAVALNRTVNATWSFLNLANEKSLKLNISALNKTLDAKWSFLNFTNEKGLKFQASCMNKTVDATWSFVNSAREKSLKFNASALNTTLNAKWSFLNHAHEKGLKFQAGALNRTIEAAWSFVNSASEKSLKFNASALNKTIDAKWSFLNVSNEKGLRFQATAFNKTIDATWTFLNSASEKCLKFNASALNKTLDARWSFLNFTDEKGLKFQASALNKTIDATLSLISLPKGKSLRFNASALNKTINATWSFISMENEKSLVFKANLLNKTVNATWTILNLEKEKGLLFKASAINKTLETSITFFNLGKEKGLKISAKAQNKTIDASWIFLNVTNEKSLKFKASAFNRTVESVWSILNFPTEKGIKFSVTGFKKTIDAAWTYINLTNEKIVKFNVSGMRGNVEATWSYLKTENERSIKVNASVMNKTAEAVWSYSKSKDQRALKFKAALMNKTIEASWSYMKNEKERAIMFNASALNKTVTAVWGFVRNQNESALRFKVSTMNRTAETVLSYFCNENERSVKFNASVMNKTVEAVWRYANGENEKSLQFKASALNKSVEAIWSYSENENERAIKVNVSALNKTSEAIWSYIREEKEATLKFKATAMNRTIQTMWSYMVDENGRSIKFNASALNKTAEAIWSYSNNAHGRSIKFKATTLNKTMEAVWTLLNTDSEKGLQFNLAVMNKTANASLIYFSSPSNLGVRFNVSCCNKSFELESKLVFQERQKKLVINASYQNYTVALIGIFQNSTTQKRACLFPKYVGRSHGGICAIFTNSSVEKSLSLNFTILNRTGELKTQWVKNRVEMANRVTVQFNRTTLLESWLSFLHTTEKKSLNFNTTVINKSASASLYFRNTTVKAIGFEATALKKHVGVEGVWFNGKTLKEAAVQLFWNKTVVAKTTLKLLNNSNRKMIEVRSQVDRFAAEWQSTLISQSGGVKELIMTRMARNGSQSLFFDSSKLTWSKTSKSLSLGYQYNLKLMGRSYEHGWVAAYNNYSNAEDSYHEATVSLIYFKDKVVTLTDVYKNNTEELSNVLTLNYLPEKTMTHSLTWFKKSNSVKLSLELLPRRPITWTTTWNTEHGISINSAVEFLNKKIENWFTYSRTTGEYSGHFEICPAYPVKVSGLLIMENGLHLTSEISAFKRTWNHMINFRKNDQQLLISVEVVPNVPVALDINWNTNQGMQIAMDLKGFNKSLQLFSSYDNLTKTLVSGLTVLKKTFTLTEKLDIERKTLVLMLAAFNRTVGFTGRFDWNNYIASSFVRYQNNQAGWLLRFNPAARSIVFNVTVSPRISGQIVGEMPNNGSVQVTLQRKLGVNVVNESRLMYLLNAKASRLTFTWNTTSVNTLVGRVQDLKSVIRSTIVKYYNLTVRRAKNYTKELDRIVKTLEAKIRPAALKVYARVKRFDYNGLVTNLTAKAQNATLRLINVTFNFLNGTVKRFSIVMRNASVYYKGIVGNATDLFKSINLNVTEAYERFRREVLPPIVGNVTLHLKSISRDIKVWANNVSLLVGSVTLRGQNLKDIAENVSGKVKVVTAALLEKVKLKTRELIVKIREVEIRGEKVGPLFDEYVSKVEEFTCGFNTSCTLENLTVIAQSLGMSIRNITVLNKTVEEHVKLLNKTIQQHFKQFNTTLRQQFKTLHKQACFVHQIVMNFTRNATRILPRLVRNVTIQAIRLARNFSKEVRIIAVKVRNVTLATYTKLTTINGPLINFTTKAYISIKGKVYPLMLKVFHPIRKFAMELNNNVSAYLRPIVPLALGTMYQLRNITIRGIPIGHTLDKAVIISLKLTSETLKSINHTLSSNITAVVSFIRENAAKKPEEIIDFTIRKSIQLYNLTMKVFNQSLHLNLGKHVSLAYNKSVEVFNKTLQKLLELRPKDIIEISIKRIEDFASNITAEVLNITKQLRALDFILRLKIAWAEMDLKGKIEALGLEARWQNLVQRIRAVNIKERALLVKYYISNVTLKVQNELQDLIRLTQHMLNLTGALIRMNTTKEVLFEEFISLVNESSRIFIKYGIMARNTTSEWRRKLLNASYETINFYKSLTLNKTIEGYILLKKHGQAFYDEHRDDALKVYNFYKNATWEMYEELKENAVEKLQLYRANLTMKVNALVAKLRQCENMTYEEIVIKTYEFSRKHGLAIYNNVTLRAIRIYRNVTIRALKLYKNISTRGLQYYKNISLEAISLYRNATVRVLSLYKNISAHGIQLYKNITVRGIQLYKNVTLVVSQLYKNVTLRANQLYKNVTLRAIELFNVTENATLKAYNLTLTLVNRTKLLTIKYLVVTRNLTLHYFNVTRNYTLQYYNLTRSLAFKYYQKYYNLSRNYTLYIYNVTRNMTFPGLNKTREFALRGIRYLQYLNETLVPIMKKRLLTGKVLAERYVNETVLFVRGTMYMVKVWYRENKEKTVDELYYEVYQLAEHYSVVAKELLRRKYGKIKERVQEKINQLQTNLNIKLEGWKENLHKLNTTVVNMIAEAISLYNQTVDVTYIAAKELVSIFHPYVTSLHNKTVIYFVQAKNISLPLIGKARNFTLLRLDETRKLINETYKNLIECEHLRDLIQKLQLKQRYAKAEGLIRKKYEELEEYVKEIKPTVQAKVQEAVDYLNVSLPLRFKERYIFVQEKYQMIMANPRIFIERVLRNALMYLRNATRETPIEEYLYEERWVELIEQAKQHELVEVGRNLTNYTSDYVRLAVKLASKNLKLFIEQLKNQTSLIKEKVKAKVQETRQTLIENLEGLRAKKLREIVEHDYVYQTIELAKNVTLRVKDTVQGARNLTRKIMVVGQLYYKNITAKVGNYTLLLRMKVHNYTKFLKQRVQNYSRILNETIRNYTKILNETVYNYTKIIKAQVKNYTNLINVTVQSYTRILNASIQNYTKILNASLKHYTKILNASIKHYAKILNASVQNYTSILQAKVQNYTKIVKAHFKNFTLALRGHYERIYESHFLPLYRNGTIMVYKYKAMAQHCIGRCSNVTLRAISMARNWTTAKLNLTRAWINQTLEKGIKYYRDELKPLYHSKVLPFYNNTLQPMYHNLSKLVGTLKRNLTVQAIIVKERAINLTDQLVNLTINSHPYAVLRKVGKMTIRESVIEGRSMYIRAYNYTLNLTRLVVNVTLTKLNVTKTRLELAINKTMLIVNTTIVEAKPVIAFLNATRLEMMETAVFICKYYGLEDSVKERVRRSLDITKNVTMKAVNAVKRYAPVLLKTSTAKALGIFNYTIPYARDYLNRTIVYFNGTVVKARHLLNVSIHNATVLLNQTLYKAIQLTRAAFNGTVPKIIRLLNVSIHNATVLLNQTLYKAIQLTRTAFNGTVPKTIRLLNVTIHNATVLLNQTLYKAIQLTRTAFNGTVPKTIRLLNVTIHNATVLLNQTIHKAIQVTRTAVNGTVQKMIHLLNLSIHNATVLLNETIQKTIQVTRTTFNETVHKTIQYARVAFNKTVDKTVQLAQAVLNTTINKAKSVFNYTISRARFSIQKVRVAVNETIDKARISLERVRLTINETIADFRAALPNYIQVRDGEITLVVPHPRAIQLNITSLAVATIGRLRNLSMEARGIIFSKIEALKQDAVLKFETLKTTLQSFKVNALDKINTSKEEVLKKMETLKREVVATMNSLKKNALLKMEELKVNALEKVSELKVKAANLTRRVKTLGKALVAEAMNRTVLYQQKAYGLIMEAYNITRRVKTIGKALVAVAMNRTVLYHQKAYGYIMEAYNISKNYPATARYINVTLHYINITKDLADFYRQNGYAFVMNAYNLTKNHPVIMKFLNLTVRYFALTKELAVKYHQTTIRLATNYYNLTRNHPIILEYTNKTLQYFGVAKNYVRGLNLTHFKNTTAKYLARVLNVSRRYFNIPQIRNITEKYLVQALNITRQYLNVTQIENFSRLYLNQMRNLTYKLLNVSRQSQFLNQVRNMTYKFLDLSRRCTFFKRMRNVTHKFLALSRRCTFFKQMRNATYKFLDLARRCTFFKQMRNATHMFLNLSRRCTFLNQPKNVTLKYLYRAVNLSRHCLNITQKYLSQALNLSRHWYRIGVNATLNYSIQVYRIAENVTLDIYNSSCLKEAFAKATKYSTIALNATVKLCSNYSSTALNKTMILYKNYSTVALNKTLALYRETLNRARNLSVVAVKKTIKIYRRMRNRALVIISNTTLVKQYIPMVKKYVPLAINITRNFTVQTYRVAVNVTLDVYNSSCLEEAFNKTRRYSKIAFNATMKVCQVAMVRAKNVSAIALNKTFALGKNYSAIALNKAIALYNKTLELYKNSSKIALNKTVAFYNKTVELCRNYPRIALNKTVAFYNKTVKLCRRLYNRTMTVVYNTTLVKHYIPMVKKYVPLAVNATRNITVRAYKVVVNITMDIYNSSCLGEAFNKTRNYSRIAVNKTLKLYQVAVVHARNISGLALNKTFALYKNYSTIALNKTIAIYNKTLDLYRNCSKIVLNKTMACFNKTLGVYKNYSSIVLNKTIAFYNRTVKLCKRLYKKSMVIVSNTTLVKYYIPIAKKYLPIAVNTTRNFTLKAYRLVVNVTLDIYNSSCLGEAFNKTRNYSKMAFNTTVRMYKMAAIKARNYSGMVLNKTLGLYKNYSTIALNKTLELYGEVLIKVKNYSALNKTIAFCQVVYIKGVEVTNKYLPMAYNLSRQWCGTGFNTTRSFVLQVYRNAVNTTLDICQSENLPQALVKFRNYSIGVFDQTVELCQRFYRQLYNATLKKYRDVYSQSLALYREIAYHEITVECINKARSYFHHTKHIVKMRVRNFHRAKGHLQKRVNHHINRVTHLLNPINWIPPFNSTAMIFGGPHVYTFDGTYYTFPGYKKPNCMYVLARDVRDNKFTIMSQETAILVVTKDSSVKIYQDGRVETIVKITTSGKKTSDGFVSELPVETLNTTVQREGSFIILRHDLGLEVVCDVEHYLCTFNIAKWYHGRMAGLLGTNNNEFHDEFMTVKNKPTKKLTEFVNSWEITRDPECKIHSIVPEKPKCKETSYIQRCRALFKDKKSPLHRYFSVVNPEPFVKACEIDYKDCETSTPKDMKHCNTTAAYIELVRMRGEWAEYLPECGRCGSNQMGKRWFQRANNMVDVVVLVHETSVLKAYAEKIPSLLGSITKALDSYKYSFKFGVMAFGGRLSHGRPHAITLNGQLMNDLDSLDSAFEHLKFAGEESENDTADALEAMAKAAYVYPFRPAATKIFLLLTSKEHSALVHAVTVDSMGKLLEAKDITLNVIGKYRKYSGEVVGQDYRGRVFYRKKPETGTGAAPLPDGEYVSLMKGTQGSVFGLPFLGSKNKDKFGALQLASLSTWREQIKRDQFTCKECFCARGDSGQGKTVCKVNSFHQKC